MSGGGNGHDPNAVTRRDWPVFVLSSHRAGSTLLRYLLDSHDELTCAPESKFIAGLEELAACPRTLAAFAGLGITADDVFAEVRTFTERIMGGYAGAMSKRRWIDKTPNYYRLTPFLDRLFAGQVLYIVLARHPLDCIASLERFWTQGGDADPDLARNAERHGTSRYGWSRYWLDVYERLAAFAASVPDRCTTITYEALVRAPEPTLAAVLQFIGERHQPDLAVKAFRERHTIGYGDPSIERAARLDAERVGKWSAWPRGEVDVLWDSVEPVAVRFGYERPSHHQTA
jgi:protein-tyrosine sulfotransferase